MPTRPISLELRCSPTLLRPGTGAVRQGQLPPGLAHYRKGNRTWAASGLPREPLADRTWIAGLRDTLGGAGGGFLAPLEKCRRQNEEGRNAGRRGKCYGVCVALRGELWLGSLHRRHQALDCRCCLGPCQPRSASTRAGLAPIPPDCAGRILICGLTQWSRRRRYTRPSSLCPLSRGGDSRVFMRNGGGL